MPKIIVGASARREIEAHGIYLEEHAGPEVADGFLAAVVVGRTSRWVSATDALHATESAISAHAQADVDV